MINIHDKIEGNIKVAENTNLHGMAIGTVTVLPNVTLNLHGMITGSLILEHDCTAFLYGTVNGNITNKGGSLKIFGTVNGIVFRENGTTEIDVKAQIRDGIM